ncbi:MAG: exodeoxyribonuclease VII small subunit [Synechococcus lacustris]
MASAAAKKSKPSPSKPLSYAEAQGALERTLVQLQNEELEIEQLPELYAEAMVYEQRCLEVLQQVTQEIQQLDPENLSLSPLPSISPLAQTEA